MRMMLWLLLLPVAALAETAYVTDTLRLGLHRAADTSDRPFRNLESGQEMEVLSRTQYYAEVQLPDGTQGYVKAGFLVSNKPAKLVVAETQAEVDRLTNELEEARQAFAAPAATIDSLRRATTECTVEYMLATGRSWKGVLERCTVSFEFMDISSAHIKHYSPEDGVVKENRVIWEYADYEPRSVLILSYNPYMPVEDIPEVFRSIAEQRSKDPSLVRAAGHYCGVWGRTDVEFEIYHSFLAKWDEPIPQLMEYASGGRCRYNFKADHHFYSIWLMARVLFARHRKLGTIEECRDIAPTVSRISSAIVDSLDTCGGLPASSEGLLRDAKDLLSVSKGLMNATVER